jgi:hypothetical protein
MIFAKVNTRIIDINHFSANTTRVAITRRVAQATSFTQTLFTKCSIRSINQITTYNARTTVTCIIINSTIHTGIHFRKSIKTSPMIMDCPISLKFNFLVVLDKKIILLYILLHSITKALIRLQLLHTISFFHQVQF